MKRSSEERKAFCEAAAAHMVANPTMAEEKLWRELESLGFDRQVPYVGCTKNGGEWRYILDFFHWGYWICVEVDGGIHARTKGRDRRRDTRLAQEDIRTLRYSNHRVEVDLRGVVYDIQKEMEWVENRE
jgi:very-short-patch-repair endonuclease